MSDKVSVRSRRAVLTGMAGAAALTITRAFGGRPSSVRAAGDDGAVINVGDTIADAQTQTTLANRANNERVLWVASNSDVGNGAGTAVTGFSAKGVGAEGWSNSGTGLYGHSNLGGDGVSGASGSGVGVRAVSSTGTALRAQSTSGDAVRAISGGTGVPVYASASGSVPAVFGWHAGTNAGVVGRSGTGEDVHENAERTGVYGESQLDEMGRGVWGSASWGRGVFAETQTGVGMFASASSGGGLAIRASGRVRFDKVSGVAKIAAGKRSVTLSPGVNIGDSSFVLLTPMSNIGARSLWFTKNKTADTITIRMSSTRSSGTEIAWLLLG